MCDAFEGLSARRLREEMEQVDDPRVKATLAARADRVVEDSKLKVQSQTNRAQRFKLSQPR